MTDAVATPDLVPPAAPSPEAETPPPTVPPVTAADQTPPHRRRQVALLLILSLLLLGLLIFAAWYLLFRQPVETLIPNLDLTKPPSYQLSTYNVSQPIGVAVSSDGSRIYVTQGGGDESTVLIDTSGNHLATLAPPADVTARASQLYVAVDPKTGDVYATDRTNGAVYVYAADGTYKSTFDPSTGGSGITVWQPLAIAFDAQGDLYVSDVGGDYQKVHVFGPDGTWLRDLGSAGLFSFPNGIGVDQNGNVYVADSDNGRLIVFDKTGTQVGVVERGPSDGQLGMPRGVVVDGQGRVYVVDAVAQSVQIFRVLQPGDTKPVFLASFGSEGTVDGTFEFPNGVAVDGRGRVYVADWNNNRLQMWSY